MVTSVFDLTGEVALVVGAAEGGLGDRAARDLTEAGATVAIADVPGRKDDLLGTPHTSLHEVDVTDEVSVAALVGRRRRPARTARRPRQRRRRDAPQVL